MAKTLREIVKDLRAQGIPITYRDRTDGSIIITSIGGTSYQGQGAAGNKAARAMAHETLSPSLEQQMRQAFKGETGYGPDRKKKNDLDDETLKLLRKTQRAIRKARKEGVRSGTVTKQNVRDIIKSRGVKYAHRVLKDIINKAKDMMTDDERHWLAESIRQAAVDAEVSDDDTSSAEDMQALAYYIESNPVSRPNGKMIYQILYDYQEGKITAATFVASAREILGVGDWSYA